MKNTNLEDNKGDADELEKTKLKTEVTDQIVPVPDSHPCQEEEKVESDRKNVTNGDFHSVVDKQCEDIIHSEEMTNLSSMYEDVDSPENFDDYDDGDDDKPRVGDCGGDEHAASENGKTQERIDSNEIVENVFDTNSNNNLIIDASNTDIPYDTKEKNTNYEEVVKESTETENIQETYVAEDSLLPLSVDVLDEKESPFQEADPMICSTGSVEEDHIDDDNDDDDSGGSDDDYDEDDNNNEDDDDNEDDNDNEEQDDGIDREADIVDYTIKNEEENVNDTVEVRSNVDYTATPEGKGTVPEVEDVTCDSGGDTVIVMNHEVCTEELDVNKTGVCTVEEITYPEHLNSIESVDNMIFHPRSTVIETGNTSASLQASKSNVINCEDSDFVCDISHEKNVGVVRYCNGYETMDVSMDVFPKRGSNTVHISSIPEPSERDFYVYNSSVPNLMHCRETPVSDVRTLHATSNLSSLETYSFHRVPVESSSIKNTNVGHGHPNTALCPFLPDTRFEYDNNDVKSASNLPAEEDFMRRIEKTLFESKIEKKIEESLDSKYKSELDLSLPLKKRLRTLAAVSDVSCTPQKVVLPKEESFPSYPVKPMISIAELEFTAGLIPKPRKSYLDNYK